MNIASRASRFSSARPGSLVRPAIVHNPPRLSNAATLIETYDWYLAHRDELRSAGVTHRVPWNQQALGLLKRVS